MSRNLILVVGALLWTVAILDGLAHLVSGDLARLRSLMVVVGIAACGLDRRATPGSTERFPEDA